MRHSLSANVLQKTIFNLNALPAMSHEQFDISNFDMRLHKMHKNTYKYLCKILKRVPPYKWSDICLMLEDTISYLSASMSSSCKCYSYHSVEHNFLCLCASMLHLPCMQVPQRCLFLEKPIVGISGETLLVVQTMEKDILDQHEIWSCSVEAF